MGRPKKGGATGAMHDVEDHHLNSIDPVLLLEDQKRFNHNSSDLYSPPASVSPVQESSNCSFDVTDPAEPEPELVSLFHLAVVLKHRQEFEFHPVEGQKEAQIKKAQREAWPEVKAYAEALELEDPRLEFLEFSSDDLLRALRVEEEFDPVAHQRRTEAYRKNREEKADHESLAETSVPQPEVAESNLNFSKSHTSAPTNLPFGYTNMGSSANKKRPTPNGTPRDTKRSKRNDPFNDPESLMEDPKAIIYQAGTNIKSVLQHPLAVETLANSEYGYQFGITMTDEQISDIAAFKENGRAGRYDQEWVRQAFAAGDQRAAGEFEEYERDKFLDYWGGDSGEEYSDSEDEKAPEQADGTLDGTLSSDLSSLDSDDFGDALEGVNFNGHLIPESLGGLVEGDVENDDDDTISEVSEQRHGMIEEGLEIANGTISYLPAIQSDKLVSRRYDFDLIAPNGDAHHIDRSGEGPELPSYTSEQHDMNEGATNGHVYTSRPDPGSPHRNGLGSPSRRPTYLYDHEEALHPLSPRRISNGVPSYVFSDGIAYGPTNIVDSYFQSSEPATPSSQAPSPGYRPSPPAYPMSSYQPNIPDSEGSELSSPSNGSSTPSYQPMQAPSPSYQQASPNYQPMSPAPLNNQISSHQPDIPQSPSFKSMTPSHQGPVTDDENIDVISSGFTPMTPSHQAPVPDEEDLDEISLITWKPTA